MQYIYSGGAGPEIYPFSKEVDLGFVLLYSNIMRFRNVLIFALPLLPVISTPAFACSWAPPQSMTSEWLDDKIIFWGRPLESKWNGSTDSERLTNEVYTEIEVLEQIKGVLPKRVGVYHEMISASCGIVFHLGSIDLIVIEKDERGNFRTEAYLMEAVNTLALTAYVSDEVDLPLSDFGFSSHPNFAANCPAKQPAEMTRPEYCKWESVFEQAKKSYLNKTNHILEKEASKKWWQKLSWFN